MILAHLAWQEEAAPILAQLRLRERDATSSERVVLDRRPPSDPAVDAALRAWSAASTCRPVGFVVGPIPQDVIDAWCDRRGLDLEAADFLSEALRYVDGVVIERAASKRRVSGAKE